VEGAIRKDADRDVLHWNAIPNLHQYRSLAGQVEIEHPGGGTLARPPEVPHAVSARHEGNRSQFTLPELARDVGVPVWVDFRSGFAVMPPRWQTAEMERRERVSTAWTAGLMGALIAGVAGILALLRFHGSTAPNPEIPFSGMSVPDDPAMPPAVAARLAGAGPGIHGALGTLFDLARRGVVAIREGERGRWRQRAYGIEPRNLTQHVLPFELALLDLLFGHEHPPKPRDFSDFVNKLATSGGKVHDLVEQHMISLGLLDPERIDSRKKWTVTTLLVTLGGLMAGVVGYFASVDTVRTGSDQWLPVAAGIAGVGTAVFVLGIAGLVVSACISPYSRHGAVAAGPWRGLRDKLAAIARDNSEAQPGDFDRWLPLAVAFGLGAAWVKRFRKDGAVPTPEWFAGEAIGHFAFYDFVAHSSASADASAGGGDGGGGSGGGSSSAG
jgi:hypothetical protein